MNKHIILYILLSLFPSFAGAQGIIETDLHWYDGEGQLRRSEYVGHHIVSFTFDENKNRTGREVVNPAPSTTVSAMLISSTVRNASGALRTVSDSSFQLLRKLSDENGVLRLFVPDTLNLGDSLKFWAAGYDTLTIVVDNDFMLNEKRVVVPMVPVANPASVSLPINPDFEPVKFAGVLPNNQIALQAYCDNCTEVAIKQNDGTYLPVAVATPFNFPLIVGPNELKMRFSTATNTVERMKGVYHSITPMSYGHRVIINVPAEHQGKVRAYCLEENMGLLRQSTDTLYLYNRSQIKNLDFLQFGYEQLSVDIQNDTLFTLALTPLPLLNDTITMNFAGQNMHYWHKSDVTLRNSGNGTVELRKVFANYDTLGLKELTATIGGTRSGSGILDFFVGYDQIYYPTYDSLMLGLWQGTSFQKILYADFAASNVDYDSAVQNLKVYGLTNPEVRFVLLKPQAPVLLPSVPDTLWADQGYPYYLPLATRVSDPDSLRGSDFPQLYAAHLDSSAFTLSASGDTLRLAVDNCQVGPYDVVLEYIHDGLRVTDSLVFYVRPMEDSTLMVTIDTTVACHGDIFTLTAQNTDNSLHYVVRDENNNVRSDTLAGTGADVDLFVTATDTMRLHIFALDLTTSCELRRTTYFDVITLPRPPQPDLPNDTLCYLASIPTYSQIGHLVEWFDAMGTLVHTGNDFIPLLDSSVAATSTLTFQVTNSVGCTSPLDTFSITVLPPNYVAPTSATILCSNEPYELVIDPTDTLLDVMYQDGSTGSSFVFQESVSVQTDFWVVVTTTNLETGCTEVDSVLFTVVPPIANNLIASDQELCVQGGEQASELLGSHPTGGRVGEPFLYRWEASTDFGATWTAMGFTQNFMPPTPTDTTLYRRIVQNVCADTSNVISLMPIPEPNASISAGSMTICAATPEPDTLHAIADYATSYQWYLDGNVLAGENNSYILLDSTRSSGYYSAEVSNYHCSDTVGANVEVKGRIRTIRTVNQTQICFGDSTYLGIRNTVDNHSYEYEWLKDGVSTGTFGRDFFASEAGVYTVRVLQDGMCVLEVFIARISVFPKADATLGVKLLNGDSLIVTSDMGEQVFKVCSDNLRELRFFSANEDSVEYTWTRNGQPISRAAFLTTHETGVYQLHTKKGDCWLSSAPIRVEADESRIPVVQGFQQADTVLCPGNFYTISGNLHTSAFLEISGSDSTQRVNLERGESFTFNPADFAAVGTEITLTYGYNYENTCEIEAFTQRLRVMPSYTPRLYGAKNQYCTSDTFSIRGNLPFNGLLTIINATADSLIARIPLNEGDTLAFQSYYFRPGQHRFIYEAKEKTVCDANRYEQLISFQGIPTLLPEHFVRDTTTEVMTITYTKVQFGDTLEWVQRSTGQVVSNNGQITSSDKREEFKLRKTNLSGCTGESDWMHIVLLPKDECFVLYPNPTGNGVLKLEVLEEACGKITAAKVIDVLGREISPENHRLSFEGNYLAITLGERIANGSYILKFQVTLPSGIELWVERKFILKR